MATKPGGRGCPQRVDCHRIGDSCDHLTTISDLPSAASLALSAQARADDCCGSPRRSTSNASGPTRSRRAPRRALHRSRPPGSPERGVHAAARLANGDRSGRPRWPCARAHHRWGRSERARLEQTIRDLSCQVVHASLCLAACRCDPWAAAGQCLRPAGADPIPRTQPRRASPGSP